MDGSQLDANNPFRTADWRHQTAERLVLAGQFPSRRLFDADTCAIARYLNWRRRPDRLPGDAVPPEYASLHAAYELHETCAPRLRAALEAFIIADETSDSITAKLGVSEACVRWYETAFFDVRSRLNAPAFIIHELIDSYRRQSTDDWARYVWKLVAYLAGSSVLAQVMGLEKVQDLPHLMSQLQKETCLALHEKTRQAAQGLAVDHPGTVAQLLQLAVGAADKSSTEPVLNDYEQNVKEMMANIPWRVGPGKNADSPLAEYESCAAEPRADQMMQIVFGEMPLDIENLKAKKLRPPNPSEQGSQTRSSN